jgi:hypothetical protein
MWRSAIAVNALEKGVYALTEGIADNYLPKLCREMQ